MQSRWMLFFTALFATASLSAAADDHIAKREKNTRSYLSAQPAEKRAEVFRLVPHLAVSGQWKSVLTFRSDNAAGSVILLEFYDENGLPIEATFFDSDGFEYNAAGFEFELFGFEIYQLEFDQLADNQRSIQVFAFVDESQDTFGLEAVYNNFSGQDKLSSVGVGLANPGDLFVVNFDQRVDAYTGNRKFRGMAVTNTALDSCQCDVQLYNGDGSDLDRFGAPFEVIRLDIPPSGKWLGTVYDLYPDIDDRLLNGLGYAEVICNQFVSPFALAFEQNAPIVSSVPVDVFVQNKAKDGSRTRINSTSLSASQHRQ